MQNEILGSDTIFREKSSAIQVLEKTEMKKLGLFDNIFIWCFLIIG
jgi:hypothetical protein